MKIHVLLGCVLHVSLVSFTVEGQLYDQFSRKFGLYALGTQDYSGLDGSCHSEDPECRSQHSVCPPGQHCQHVTSCDLSGSGGSFESCAQPDGSPGFCCKTEENPGPLAEPTLLNAVKSSVLVGGLSGRALNENDQRGLDDAVARSLVDGQQFSYDVSSFFRQTSSNPLPSQVLHHQQNKPRNDILSQSLLAAGATWSSKQLSESGKALTSTAENAGLPRAMVRNCPRDPLCDPGREYRSFDGSCNNLKHPKWGMAGTPLQRIAPNAYRDGFFLPRVDQNGGPLPSARWISLMINGQLSRPNPSLNNFFTAFAQFVVHDISQVPFNDGGSGRPPNCCPLSVANNPAAALVCFPIPVPQGDPAFNRDCISFVRSMGGISTDCEAGTLEQNNQVTHFMDGSQIYGSDAVTNAGLRRARVRGMLDFQFPTPNGMLPPMDPNGKNEFLFGDSRANQQPFLALQHIIWFREHNRIALQLSALNRGWTDGKIFEESRKIVTAQLQHIVYKEFLPQLLGKKLMTSLGMNPLATGFSKKYSPDINPSIVNAFSAAAMRLHTLLASDHFVFNPPPMPSQSSRLKSTFGKLDFLLGFPNQIVKVLVGEVMAPSESFDQSYIRDITQDLFGDAPNGLDLVAIHIQRGRDHGLPGYIKYREICSKAETNSFDDLKQVMELKNVELLKKIYRNVADIDLFVGMSLEKATFEGTFLGNTFLCLISDQFLRTKMGDRFFYENQGQSGSFSEEQLNSIRQTSMARIICDNFPDVPKMPGLAFLKPDNAKNRLLSCANEIPSVNLNLWAEP